MTKEKGKKISPAQCRAARALLDWGRTELCNASEVSGNTIARIEQGRDAIPATMKLLVETFEREGIVFTRMGGVEFKEIKRE